MPIVCDSALYSVVREEHLFHNDFFLRYLDFVDEPVPEDLIFTCFAGEKPCYFVRYEGEEIERRFRYGEEETARYRRSSLPRILGRSTRLQNPFLHEYFSFFCSEIVDGLVVKAKCGGIVEEVFDGLPDTDDSTDLEQVEKQYGEHVRIDGNHVLIRHEKGEYSLYAHLLKDSISVKTGDKVSAGQQIGCVGSSGSSYLPHLHFHVMLDGIDGPGVPVQFDGLKTILGEPCLLEDTVNLVRYTE